MLVSSAALSAKTVANHSPAAIVKSADKLELSLSLGDLSKMSKEEVNAKINKFITDNVPANPVLQCSVTVKGSVDIGVASVEISVTVSGTCDEIKKAGTEIANQVLTAVKKALQE
jgi:hypothetical protein